MDSENERMDSENERMDSEKFNMDSELALSNINITRPRASKKRIAQRMSWFFTYNNYTEDSINLMTRVFNEICDKFIFQKEKGKGVMKITDDGDFKIDTVIDGTHHLQGVIFLKKKMRWSEFGLPNNIHWEGTRNKKASIDYCQKLETSQGEIYTKGIEITKKKKPIKIIPTDILYKWQKELYDISNQEPDDRLITWIYEPKGCEGKTSILKKILVENPETTLLIRNGKSDDIMKNVHNFFYDKNGNEIENRELKNVIIDLPRGTNNDYLNAVALESIKDGLIVNNKYQGGHVIFNSPNLIILSNERPTYKLINNFSIDRWRIGRIIDKNENIRWENINIENDEVNILDV